MNTTMEKLLSDAKYQLYLYTLRALYAACSYEIPGYMRSGLIMTVIDYGVL